MFDYDTVAIFLNNLVFLTYLILFIAFLSSGIFTIRRKPIIYKYYIEVILYLIAFILSFSIFLFSILTNHINLIYFFWIYTLIPFLSSRKPLHTLILYNVDQKMIYKSIIKMLKQNNISFEVHNGNLLLPSLKADIKVKIRPFNQATIHFKLEDKKIKDNLISDFKKNLSKQKLDKFPSLSLATIIISITVIIILILIWPLILL